MAAKKKGSGRSRMNEGASVNSRKSPRAKSSKYRPGSDSSKRPPTGSGERYWRAGCTSRDGTKVKGYYVNKSK